MMPNRDNKDKCKSITIALTIFWLIDKIKTRIVPVHHLCQFHLQVPVLQVVQLVQVLHWLLVHHAHPLIKDTTNYENKNNKKTVNIISQQIFLWNLSLMNCHFDLIEEKGWLEVVMSQYYMTTKLIKIITSKV